MVGKTEIDQQNIIDLFSYWVEKNPDKMAITTDSSCYTYRELDILSDNIARQILRLRKPSNITIGIYLSRSAELIIAALGILKADCTYMVLDVEYPKERLAHMLHVTGTELIFTKVNYIAELDSTNFEKQTVIEMNVTDMLLLINNVQPANRAVFIKQPQNLAACILFTSGTTGWPKGVLIRKSSIINLVVDTNYIDISTEDIISHASHVSFDLSLFDIWGGLLNGATVAVFKPQALVDIDYFETRIKAAKVTISYIPTGAFHELVKVNRQLFTGLKTIILGGEKASAKLVQDFFRYFEENSIRAPTVINTYGPTENTTNSTYYRMVSRQSVPEDIPIGKPIKGVEVLLLDENYNPVRPGVNGEVYVAGDNLSLGYIGAAQQDERFLTLMINDKKIRAYRTGDIAFQGDNGNFYYVGRIDHQFKRQGKRIEPGEIEEAFMRHPAVLQSIVNAQRKPSVLIYAYIVLKPGKQVEASVLEAFIKSYLPSHMIPNTITVMDALPLTVRGKVDRTQLPIPAAVSSTEEVMTECEKVLAALWCEHLGLSTVKCQDNFFSLGGDSIIAIQIAGKAKKQGIVFNPAVLFSAPTLQALAAKCQKINWPEKNEQGVLPGVIPLMPIQQWFFAQFFTNHNYFNQSFILTLQPGTDINRLERAIQQFFKQQGVMNLTWHQSDAGWKIKHHAQSHCVPVNIHKISRKKILKSSSCQRIIELTELQLDISEGRLAACNIFSYKNDEAALLHIAMHHIITDGVSWRLLVDTVNELYEKGDKNEVVISVTNNSYLHWSQYLSDCNKLVSDEAKKFWQKSKWRQVTTLPSTLTKLSNQQSMRSFNCFQLLPEETDKLLHQCLSFYGANINALLLTAMSLSWKQICHVNQIVFVCEGHGRESNIGAPKNVDLSGTLGWFTSLFPVALTIPDGALAEQVCHIQSQLNEIPHRGLGFLPLLFNHLGQSAQRDFIDIPIKFNYLGQFSQVEDLKRISAGSLSVRID